MREPTKPLVEIELNELKSAPDCLKKWSPTSEHSTFGPQKVVKILAPQGLKKWSPTSNRSNLRSPKSRQKVGTARSKKVAPHLKIQIWGFFETFKKSRIPKFPKILDPEVGPPRSR